MKTLPKTIIRLDDGMRFLLNERTNKYHIELAGGDYNSHYIVEYSYEQLMEYKGLFKVADGTEDLKAMRDNWIKRCVDNNDGHGNGDDDE